MLLIDANIFLAYENLDDANHAQAVGLWREIEIGKYGFYFTTNYILNEVVGVTFRKFGKEKAVKIGEDILGSTSIFFIDAPMQTEAWKMFIKTSLRLNFVDCTHLIALQYANTSMMATFDQEFQKVNGITTVH